MASEKVLAIIERVKQLNETITQLQKDAAEAGLEMGQRRYAPDQFEVYDPEAKELMGLKEDKWGVTFEDFDSYEHWIGSSVCW